MRRPKRKVTIVITSIIGLILLGLVGVGVYTYSALNKVNKVEITKSKEELNIPSNPESDKKEESKITNILLMAVDKDENASDTLIVLTIDDINNKIKMTSIMRDSYIYFGKDMVNKINYAYRYGGPLLTIKTINENYKLDIMNYMKVDFLALERIIDELGGVDINVKQEEIKVINKKIDDVVKYTNEEKSYVQKPGMQRLNGQQAVAYGRVRVVGNGDFERTERQRTMLTSLYNRLKDTSPTKFPSMLAGITQYIETSLGNAEILSLGTKIVTYGSNGIDQSRLPIEGTWSQDTSEGTYYLRWDKPKNLEFLHKFIYGDTSRLNEQK